MFFGYEFTPLYVILPMILYDFIHINNEGATSIPSVAKGYTSPSIKSTNYRYDPFCAFLLNSQKVKLLGEINSGEIFA